jgi:anaphase-promoting complex subunit 10
VLRGQLVVLYVDFKLDESYTPSKISIRAGDGFHNLKVLLFLQEKSFRLRCLSGSRI